MTPEVNDYVIWSSNYGYKFRDKVVEYSHKNTTFMGALHQGESSEITKLRVIMKRDIVWIGYGEHIGHRYVPSVCATSPTEADAPEVFADTQSYTEYKTLLQDDDTHFLFLLKLRN
jgi:hypothetical protein